MKLWRFTHLALMTTSAIALSANMAFAMPPAIGVLGSLVTTIAAGASASQIVTGLFVAALSYAANSLLASLLAPDVKPKGIKDKIESGGDLPLSFVLGTYATAGKLVYVNEYGEHGDKVANSSLVLVISLSELPISGLSNLVWANGERQEIDFDNPDTDGFWPVPGISRSGASYCHIKFYNGTQTVADPFLLDKFGTDPDKPWTDEMVGRGCAYVIVRCDYSTHGVWSGVPSFKWVVQGIPLYDPRKDSSVGGSGSHRWGTPSTWEYSDNPVVMKYNIIRGIYYNDDWVWGGQLGTDNSQAYRLPLSYWNAAMNNCDETITLSDDTTVKRYTAGGEITIDKQPIDILKELDKTCTGFTAEYGGSWRTWSGPPGASVLSITDADIIITEEQTDNLFRPSQDIFNAAHATYTSSKSWVNKDAPVRSFPDLLAEDDGYQFVADIELPFVTTGNQAQRIMRASVLDSRRQITHLFTLPPEAYILEPNDVVNWTSDRNGYVNKKFRVETIEDQPNVNQVVALREINPDDYDWDVSYELPESIGTVTQVKPGTLALDFDVDPDQVDNPSGGKDKPAIKLSWTWDAPDLDLRYVKYEIRLTGTTKVISSGTFHNTDETNRTLTSAAFRFGKQYDVHIMAVPFLRGREAAWSSWKSVTLFNVDIPTAPTLTRVSDLADDGTLVFYLDIDWTAVGGTVDYSVRVAITGGSTRIYHTDDNTFRIPATSGKTYTVDIRAVAQDGGSRGDWSPTAATTVTKKNTAPTTPSGLTVSSGFKQNSLSWTKSPDADYKETAIYRSTTNNFTTASEVGRKSGTKHVDGGLTNNTSYYYWITHFDRSGNESAKYPTSNTAGVVGLPTNVGDGDTDTTPLAAPTGLTLTQITADVDDDGKVDISFLATWTDIGATAKVYEVELSQADTSGGSYTVIDNRESKNNTAIRFRVKSTKWYKARVRAFSFNGTPGTWSSLTSAQQPNKKSASPSNVSSVSVTAKPTFVQVTFTQPTDKDFSYAKIYRYTSNTPASAVYVGSTKGDTFHDGANLTAGTTYWYFITAVDTSSNESVSKSTGVSVVWRIVQDGDTDTTALAAPSGLAITQDNADINGDGTVDIAILAGWTDSGATAKFYEVELSQSTTSGGSYTVIDDRSTKANKIRFAAKTTYWYKARIRAFNAFGNPGTWSSLTSAFQPTKKSTAPSNVSWEASNPIVAKPKQILLRWQEPADADYSKTVVYRNTVNNSATASEIGRIKATRYPDGEDLTAGTTYYYWLKHLDTSGNLSGSFSSVQSIAWQLVLDGDTDATALAAPSGLAITQDNADVDGDGKIDIAILAGWTDSGATAKHYEVELSQSATSGGSYTVIDNKTTKQNKLRFSAKTTYWYKARIRAFNFAGAPGTWSSLTSAFQPTKKSASPSTVSWAASNPIIAKPKQILLRIQVPTDTDYKQTVYYRNTANNSATATEIGREKGTTFHDSEDLTAGTTYYYWAKHEDTSGNLSGSFSSVQSVAWRVVAAAAATGDFETTALSAPTISSHTQNNTDLNGDGTVDMANSLVWGAVTNATSYEVEISRSTTSGGTYTVVSSGITNNPTTLAWQYPCNVNFWYKARVRARNAFGQPGTWSSLTAALQPLAKSTAPTAPTNGTANAEQMAIRIHCDVSPDADYLWSEVITTTSASPAPSPSDPPSAFFAGQFFKLYQPGPATSLAQVYWLRHVNRSGQRSAWVGLPTTVGGGLGPIAVSQINASNVDNAGIQIDGSQINAGSISVARVYSTFFNSGIAGMAFGDIGTYGTMKNNSGSRLDPGNLTSGANLQWSDSTNAGATSPGGQWMSVGRCTNGNSSGFLRTS